ncbi:heme peroxidase [Toensbergia leucococca]|nr:heme peroxidase [Toensbergia leucococca]
MASAVRFFTHLTTRSTPFTSTLKTHARFTLPSQAFQSSSRRRYASGTSGKASSSTGLYWGLGLAAAGGAGAYFYFNNGGLTNLKEGSAGETRGIFTPSKDDYQKVYNEIAKALEEKDDYDDGSYGPVLVRLAWHCSGTYDKETNTGGSNGATMRFAPEGDHGANAGLKAARDFMDPIKRKPPTPPSLEYPQPLH